MFLLKLKKPCDDFIIPTHRGFPRKLSEIMPCRFFAGKKTRLQKEASDHSMV